MPATRVESVWRSGVDDGDALRGGRGGGTSSFAESSGAKQADARHSTGLAPPTLMGLIEAMPLGFDSDATRGFTICPPERGEIEAREIEWPDPVPTPGFTVAVAARRSERQDRAAGRSGEVRSRTERRGKG